MGSIHWMEPSFFIQVRQPIFALPPEPFPGASPPERLPVFPRHILWSAMKITFFVIKSSKIAGF